MAVNLLPPNPAELVSVPGIKVGSAPAGIKKWTRDDVLLIELAPGSRAAGVFTQNAFAAAPVQVCRQHLQAGNSIRALVVNAGNANCGTGAQGLQAAQASCRAVAELMGCKAQEVLPFSTGVILEHLPVEKIVAALPVAQANLSDTPQAWANAAAAIMTTDTIAKARSTQLVVDGVTVSVTGIAKGVGMLEPNMATMLAYLATDANISAALLPQLVKEVADASFNRVTVDGDTSTNDSFVLITSAQAAHPEINVTTDPRYAALKAALTDVAADLAQRIARDGEGATKFLTIQVTGAASVEEAHQVGKGIANSPLVKTALFASDPNLGRVLMAVGNALPSLDTQKTNVWFGDVLVVENGGRAASYTEADGQRVLAPAEISMRVDLGRGTEHTTVWTCDFSYDYVKINAEYRT
ncbi:bifunctional glutamate N-acetyltransferase/amino-acid acetyltransferase ArgJ [Parvibium lacunae]|uniref:Arginine biosynthesis bifunctional protein ArgJ n=1 Tax=Parvibium lacunae TaxID=1888893 RepID=A0A368L1W4_9BURK|nr:bifunctional glutamate N-acetyltransferase/amino-acid acetyltransferase ArgJ [Parvibium lacunae]RCS57547.1 bifunctional glutamate N-acetyltransferase/amino-acid acetyltransferase ArgJ [Parvibium lacunae]